MFKYEMHLHTSGCSDCARSTGVELVDAAVKAGYSGFVITNHFYYGNTCVNRDLTWQEFVEEYKNDYLTAKEYAKQFDIDVLFGVEEWYDRGKELLIYGLEPDIYKKAPFMFKQEVEKISGFVRENGGFIVAAHPFRNRGYIAEPDKAPDALLFDGIETDNYFNTEEDNNKALVFATENSLLRTSGGDIHNAPDFGHSGLAFSKRITNNAELAKALKSGNYKLIIDDKII